jgi:drug/metabolite transporter (DMT)-like permease
MKSSRDFRIGLLAGASTGIFWGVPFLAPQVLPAFTPVEIAFGRFFFFGLIGFAFFGRVIAILRAMRPMEWVQVFALSALGFWLYSSLLFWSISRTDGVISSLILGLLPVTIPLFSARSVHRGPGFFAGLLLIASGLLVLVWGPGLIVSRDPAGVAGLFLCLAMWTSFTIWNSRFLSSRPWLSRRDFSSLMGMTSLLCLLPLAALSLDARALVDRPGFAAFAGISAVLGFGSSWFANWLWNAASARLPSGISGTLLVFETIFGLLYTYLWQGRYPHGFELLSILLCISGVALAIRAQITS